MPLNRAKDFDTPNPRVTAELVSIYEAAAARLRRIVLNPPGKSENAQALSRSRAAAQLAQIQALISRLKADAVHWTSQAFQTAFDQGLKTADRQVVDFGLSPSQARAAGIHLTPTLAPVVDHRAVAVLARDTLGDLYKAADAMARVAGAAVRHMAATGVTKKEVNDILAGGIIDGKPREAVRQLRDALQKVHGDTVTIIDKNGDPREFKAGYYAQMVATTKTRQAVCLARHERLSQRGVDLVIIVGRQSKNFCTAYLGKAFSISGDSQKYPPLTSLPGDGPPFHVNCSKSTAPFVDDLASTAELDVAAPDHHTDGYLNTDDTTQLQKQFKYSNTAQIVKQREAKAAAALTGQ